jgi:glycosyltransferase involved in cell wall biosynthesis
MSPERTLHAVLPAGIDDPARPSGGNVYDRRSLDGLVALGWTVVEHEVTGDWPHPDLADLARLALLLDGLPDGALLLVDGLVASAAASVLPAASTRLAVVVLLHMPLGPGAAEETVLASAAAVVTTSEWARSQVRSWYGLRHVYAVRPGTDAAPLAAGSATGTALLCVATVHPGKGHDVLLEALTRLDDRPWTLVCAGSLDVDPDHVSAVQAQVYARRWERRVTFAGPLVGSALDAAYDVADVVVLPSRGESFGMVVTEALARGLPVVATRTGGVPEAVGRAPGGALPGLLVAPDDPAALTDGLARWLDERHLRDRLRRAAVLRRPTLPGWDRTSADLADVLAQVSGRVAGGSVPGARADAGSRR